jgi:PKD repeat protein
MRRLAVTCLLILAVGGGVIARFAFADGPAPVTASFTYDPSTPLTGESVTFTSTSTAFPELANQVVSEEWDLDNDGSFETSGHTAQRSFAAAGTYTVSLRATDSLGNADTHPEEITVGDRPPSAAFTMTPNPALTGQTVSFDASDSSDLDGTIAKYEWDLDGDGSFETDSGTDPTVELSYSSPQAITVKLRVVDNSGSDATTTHSLTINNRSPTASFTGLPNPALTGQTVNFDGSASSDPDGTIADYKWDLDGNGSFETDSGTDATVSRAYASSSSVTVKLRVTDDGGATDTSSLELTVNNRAPSATFTVSPNPALTDQTVTFDASASNDPDGTITNYKWDLDGNGSFEVDTGSTDTVSRVYATSGPVTVRLLVTDDDGTTAQASRTLTVNDRPPTASFTISPNPAPTGQTVNFDASASSDPDGTIADYEWDLDGNGSFETDSGTDPTTSRSYASSGSVTVKLRVTDDEGKTNVASRVLTINNRGPTASFTASPGAPLTAQPVNFDASASNDPDGAIANYKWDLDGNGTFESDSGTDATVSHSYPSAGPVTVRLQVTDNDGNTAQATKVITVHAPPVASFTALPNPALTGQTVSFDASASSDPDGTIANYKWDLDGNGTFETNTNTTKTASSSYANAGPVTVRLQVTDNEGITAQTTRTVNVRALPIASFTASPNPALIGQTVSFDASASSDPDGTIANYKWDLDGNGTFETNTNTTNTASTSYGAAKTVTVRLLVTDNDGNTAQTTRTVTVRAPPVASFTASPSSALVGQTVNFDASASSDPDGTIADYRWDLDGNGTFENDSSTDATVSRSYSSPGPVTVRLLVTDNDGNTAQTTRSVVVHAPPTARFTFSPPTPLAGQSVQFNGSTSSPGDAGGSITNYKWDLDGNNTFELDTGTTPTTSRVYSTAGPVNVRLRVTDNNGNMANIVQTVTINSRPVSADFDLAPAEPLSGQTITFTGTASATGADNEIKSQQWDFSYDGVNFNPEASGSSVQRSFAAPGRYQVAYLAKDSFENIGLKLRTVTVGDRPPTPSFTYFPLNSHAGGVVTFVSTASDPDSSIADQRWDLNGDGTFDDGTGSTASRLFDAVGSHTVSLQVTDNYGQSAIATETVMISARPPDPPATVLSQTPGLLSPFPVVRISGTVTKRGMRLRRLTVYAPAGSRITIRCKGRHCPVRRSTYEASARAAKFLRIRRFENKLFRPGTRLEVRIVRSGLVGKYTRFNIRKARPPTRIDRCLMPNSTKPVSCPA